MLQKFNDDDYFLQIYLNYSYYFNVLPIYFNLLNIFHLNISENEKEFCILSYHNNYLCNRVGLCTDCERGNRRKKLSVLREVLQVTTTAATEKYIFNMR